LRVGFAIGPADMIAHLRLAGGPYPVSNLSQAAANRWLDVGREPTAAYVARVKHERRELATRLAEWGATPMPSQTNFVFTRVRDALWLRDAAAGLGVAIRYIPGNGDFADGLRITCPGNERDFARLLHALRVALRPQTLLTPRGSAAAAQLEATPALRARLQTRVAVQEFAAPTPISPADVLDAVSRGAEIGVASPAFSAWLVGETPEQMAAARVAGALPLAFLPPAARTAENVAQLHGAGAARVLSDLAELEVLLP
jgi:hypothetical protein